MTNPAWMPRWRWVLFGATILAVSSTVQGYRMTELGVKPPAVIPIGRLIALNGMLWLAPAIMSPAVFRLVDWLSRTNAGWIRALGFHAIAAAVFSVLHGAALFAVYVSLWWSDGRFAKVSLLSAAQSEYFSNLNFSLATYGSIAALGYALDFRHRVHRRALEVAGQKHHRRLASVAGALAVPDRSRPRTASSVVRRATGCGGETERRRVLSLDHRPVSSRVGHRSRGSLTAIRQAKAEPASPSLESKKEAKAG